MTIRQKLEILANETNSPCVTISLNTHRTHPDNEQDKVLLKKLLKEAENRVINEFGKRPVNSLLEKITSLSNEIDVTYNLESLHLFLSNDTQEIIKSVWKVSDNTVQISEKFAIRPLIKAANRTEEYYILLLSQSGVQLYETINDGVVQEIRNEDFPFSENRHYITNSDKASDPKHADNMVREFLNKVDKAVVKLHNETGLRCMVICTEDNYSRLQQVADKTNIYIGSVAIDYNNIASHHIAKQSWEVIQQQQHERRANAIEEMKEAVSNGKVLTDLQEIYQAAIDGRGELLIVKEDYFQPVLMTSDRNFELIEDSTTINAIDDITNDITREVISKKGRVFFTNQEQLSELGKIALMIRY